MSPSRTLSTLLVTLTLLFGLYLFRAFLPTVIWYLGQYLRAEQLAFYALVTFALALWDGVPPSVLLGDLNAEPDKPELQAIYEAGFVRAGGNRQCRGIIHLNI